MKSIVCIKQVIDTYDVKWSENNTLVREGAQSVVNPYDLYAIETALRLNGEVGAISMGPPQAKEALKEAIGMGVNFGVLLCDKKFAAADTFATAKTLAAGLKKLNFDLIITGQFATDGDTAQTGPSIAQNLNLPSITYVKEILSVENNIITVKREVEDGIEIVQTRLPALICMLKCDYEPRPIKIEGYIKAQDAIITEFTADSLGLEAKEVGILGSPTYVAKAFRANTQRNPKMVNNIEEIAQKIKEVQK